ncbi:hypothetical protein [Lysobacter sp. M15]|uniref:hypothetical protein n=1 Tax=Lysobacter sp. M15 TaxID=2916837 RepID=UPI001F5ADB71|nr:hypothetical protein [Lysobacter sp. M15]
MLEQILIRRIITGLALFLAASAAAAAAEPDQSHACATVAEASARLACYDKAFPPSSGATILADMEARRQQAVEDFGLNRQQRVERLPEQLRETEPDRIQGTIKGVLVRATGERVVTLESGQVWLLTEVTSRGRLKTGDQVTLREAALGSYMLVTSTGVALRAKRLR